MNESRSQRTDPLVTLSRRVERLDGGTLSIGDFNKWFTSLEWDDLIASDSAALRLSRDIRNILYQHADDPDDVTERAAIDAIAGALTQFAAQSGSQRASAIASEPAAHRESVATGR